MEHGMPPPAPLERTMRFLKLTGLHAEGFARGEKWIRSKIADLKIDLWLATEQGEGERSPQVDDIQLQIETLDAMLWPSIFDREDEGGYFLQSAASDLARYAVCIANVSANGKSEDHRSLLLYARAFLETADARDEAHKCMRRIEQRPGVVFEDVGDIVKAALTLLETLLTS